MNTWLVIISVLLAAGNVRVMAQTRAVASNAPSLMAIAALQTALDRNGLGVGFIDGKDGPRTHYAFLDYRRKSGLSDKKARESLVSNAVPVTLSYTICEGDLASVGSAPSDWQDAATVPTMTFESLDEVLSEKFHVSRPFLQRLNPAVTNWDETLLGRRIAVPNVGCTTPLTAAARIEIDCKAYRLRAYDTDDTLIASFPCSIARDQARVPTGDLRIASFAPNPNYTFDPANFPESPRAQEIGRRLLLPPGPNNPVGVYWITLSAPGFGIHGTPHPETIGRRESHGCFRMTNWDITTLAGLVSVGTPVHVVGLTETMSSGTP
jgi:lipoprotein-anchoring transpeptidase ErfK/SrfK